MSTRTMVQQPQPYASEEIIYRTRNEFLTDLRIIIDGTTYPLHQLEMVRVVHLAYYLPLQLLRLLAVGLAWLLMADMAGVLPSSTPVNNVWLAGVLVLVLLAFVLVVPNLVPTHAVQIKTARTRALFFHSSDTAHLQSIVRQIKLAIERLPSG